MRYSVVATNNAKFAAAVGNDALKAIGGHNLLSPAYIAAAAQNAIGASGNAEVTKTIVWINTW
jgi:hypothetical protein